LARAQLAHAKTHMAHQVDETVDTFAGFPEE
jgi:hypothetical protein